MSVKWMTALVGACLLAALPAVAKDPVKTTDSGLRVTVMLRCADKGCSRQWQFVGVLMSLSGAEYQGAA